MAKWSFLLPHAYFLFYPTLAATHQENTEHKTYFASENLCNIQLFLLCYPIFYDPLRCYKSMNGFFPLTPFHKYHPKLKLFLGFGIRSTTYGADHRFIVLMTSAFTFGLIAYRIDWNNLKIAIAAAHEFELK
jgi:hypothetical protein